MIMDEKRVSQIINAQLDKIVAQFLKELPQLINRKLEAATASALGLEIDSWNHGCWRVSHAGNRDSVISGYIESKAKKVVDDIIDKIITPEVVAKCIEDAKEGVIRDFEERLKNRLKSAASDKATVLVNEILDNHMKLMIEKINTNVNIANPNQSKVDEVITEDIANNALKEMEMPDDEDIPF